MSNLVIIVVLCFFSFSNGHDVPGYYWRDFNGTIPNDALVGGMDNTNGPIYIAQVFAKFLIPAQVYQNDKRAYYEYGGVEHSVTQNIKILCTQHPEDFEWIPTDNDNIKSITDTTLISGGYEPGCSTYIGRTRKAGGVLVGKALADNLPQFAGLHTTLNGVTYHSTSFDVLAFNSNQVLDVRASKPTITTSLKSSKEIVRTLTEFTKTTKNAADKIGIINYKKKVQKQRKSYFP